MRIFSLIWVCVVGLCFLIGCKKTNVSSGEAANHDFFAIELQYKIFQRDKGYAPRNISDLFPSGEHSGLDQYHIIWGVAEISTPADRTILAYEKVAPEQGGSVLFYNGSVKRVSAEEFKKLIIATPSKPMSDRPADINFAASRYANFGAAGHDVDAKTVIELHGVFKHLSRISGNPELILISPDKPQDEVRCFFIEGDEFWSKISIGQEVSVKGSYAGWPNGNSQLRQCVISKLGPFQGVKITSEELASELEADVIKAREKYNNKSFIITGEVLSLTKQSYQLVLVKGMKEPLRCFFHRSYEADARLFPGAKIKLYGEMDLPSGLSQCELISK